MYEVKLIGHLYSVIIREVYYFLSVKRLMNEPIYSELSQSDKLHDKNLYK